MTIPDIINGSYELMGGIALAGNCVKTYNDKEIKGISLVSMVFFTSWGGWNIYYYPHLHQWMSTVGAVLLFFFNAIWLGQAFYYTKLNHGPKPEPLIEPKMGEIRQAINSYSTVTVTEVDQFSVKYQFPDGRGFRRSKRGFMKNFKPITQ